MNDQPKNPNTKEVTHQPVAYDAEGRPLYTHPPTAPAPTVVHVARSLEPEQPVMSPETQRLHEDSKRSFPLLNLSPGEYVLTAVRRHPIGLILPLATGTTLIGIALAVFFNYDIIVAALGVTGFLADISSIGVPIWVFVAIVALGMFISYYVYTNNKFFLTNESVIQEIQVSLFSRQEQTASLGSIEDASYTQHGILQQVLDYGDIRLSTEGDETTYRFNYVANPKAHIAQLNNAVEAFKNGRPVDGN
jgi:hypothetical protein